MEEKHKLLLDWPRANDAGVRKSHERYTIIDAVLDTWAKSLVDRVCVVIREDDQALFNHLLGRPAIDLVILEDSTSQMKHSVIAGLEHLRTKLKPSDNSHWMLAPADLPTLGADLIDQIIQTARGGSTICAPCFTAPASGDMKPKSEPGHPVSFPWTLVGKVFSLGNKQGLNALMDQEPVNWLTFPYEQKPSDIDTYQDYILRLKDFQDRDDDRRIGG